MPRLLRVRFVSVGHAGARFDDLLLDMRDRQGEPTDSTLWLRNGGGKTSLLSLFFALIRPDKREFLGLRVTGRTEGHPNELKDFILPEDRSLLVCEWALDGGASLFADAQQQRYLTGVFYERRSGADDDVQRLFFAGYVAADDPAMQIDGLPLYASVERRTRRTLSSFRQEWLALRERHPALQAACTENQREWGQILDGVGIDTELFAYQLRMNRRESGADELFRFSDHERFIDFLLEVAHTTELGDKLRQNLGTLRREMIERKDRLKPEEELITGLADRLVPLVELASERRNQRDTAGQVRAELETLRAYVANRLIQLETERTGRISAQEEARALSAQAKRDASEADRRAAALRLHAARARQAQAQDELVRLNSQRENALRWRYTLDAALPLRAALQAEQRAAAHRRALDERQSEAAPLLKETKDAAEHYAAALVHEASRLNEEAACHKVTAEEAERLARQAGVDVAVLHRELSQLRKAIEGHQHALAEIERQRKQLVDAGVLHSGELATDAVTRLTNARQAAKEEEASAYAAEQQHRAAAEQIDIERGSIEHQQQEREALIHSLAQALDEARTTERALCGNPLLAQLFQIEAAEVALESLLDRALAQLPEESECLQRKILELRAERATDEHACHALESTGLLPPSSDVELVLANLHHAWSGWVYLAENTRNKAALRDVVRAAPHLAAGVVVRDEDYPHVKETLERTTAAVPSSPVAVARASALLHAKANDDYHVIGPRSDAYFDKAAGQSELEQRRKRLALNDEGLTELARRKDAVDDLRHQLAEFRRRWPSGWRSNKEQAKRSAEAEVQTLSAQVAKLTTRAQELRGLETDAREKGRQAGERAQRSNESCLRAQSFEQHQEGREGMVRQALWDAEATERTLPAKIGDAEQKLESHDERARQARDESARHEVRALLLKEERGNIRYLRGEPAPQPGPLDSLRIRYEECISLYERRVSQDGLQNLLQREEEQAREERRKLGQKLEVARKAREAGRLSLTEEEVAAALQTLTDQSRLETNLEEASRAYDSVHGAKARQDQIVQGLAKQIEGTTARARELGVDTEAPPAASAADAVALEQEASAVDAEAGKLKAEAEAHEQTASAAGADAQRLWTKHEGLRKDERHIGTLIESYREVLHDASATSVRRLDAENMGSDAAVELRTSEVEKRLAELRSTQETLGARRAEAARRLRSHAKDRRFEPLGSPIAQRFSDAADIDLEASAAPLHAELLTRLKALSEQLAAMDKHRDFLIDIALEAAREGLKLLDAAASSSRVPDHMPGLGGAQFLRIQHSAPQAPAERRARIGQLIDKVLSEKELPSGLGLVQQAVRELAKPIRARVLNPDPDLERRSVEIPELARFSGGERLTCAVLLYCTLAQLRAKTRGSVRLPSSVLFLDNPIGASSRVKFLDMQRDVAQAMRVQLVYTTGVNDLDALATLPNVIRLRNERIDRARGHRHVEHAPEGGRQLAATRILLPTQTPTTPEAP